MIFNKVLVVAIVGIILFLSGYALGRRIGKKEGVNEGVCLAPLEWRKQLLKTSICPLCTQVLNVHNNEGISEN